MNPGIVPGTVLGATLTEGLSESIDSQRFFQIVVAEGFPLCDLLPRFGKGCQKSRLALARIPFQIIVIEGHE